ncbi:hypothetical protein [Marinobacterium lutimaris]|uniref:Uncharacterized protein n=1 Tax=Marinobacterium lutimaris TaxID=568106 RepID=A0A1H5Y8C2_9GAMM|nr:hypothetical protein [Marinobacterium lutimaris]SEG20241.1 hypothetical protein SAMN05444390_1011658 [Marinobacterium lutimaris]
MSLIKLTPEESLIQQARLKVCQTNECKKYVKFTMTCKPWPIGCGCFLPAKTRIMGAKCPDDYWVAMSEHEVVDSAYTNAVESLGELENE